MEYLEASNEVMDKYRPICPQDLALSGDVVEEQRLGQRNDTLAWFWCRAHQSRVLKSILLKVLILLGKGGDHCSVVH